MSGTKQDDLDARISVKGRELAEAEALLGKNKARLDSLSEEAKADPENLDLSDAAAHEGGRKQIMEKSTEKLRVQLRELEAERKAEGAKRAAGEVCLTIEGEPGAKVEVLYGDRGDDPPPPVYCGKLGSDGCVTVSIPHGYFVILSPGCETGIVHLESGPATQVVHLKKIKI